MPYRIAGRCSTPGCPNPSGGGACSEHRVYRESDRPSPQARGYDEAWKRKRAAQLRDHPLCEECDVPTPATDVHHVPERKTLVALGVADPDAPEFLHSLCKRHHSAHTIAGSINRGRG